MKVKKRIVILLLLGFLSIFSYVSFSALARMSVIMVGGSATAGSDLTNITYGSANIFVTPATLIEELNVAALDSTHFVVTYEDDNATGDALVGLVSGTTISSYGSVNAFESGTITLSSVARLDDTHFVVAYKDSGDANKGKAVVGLTSGTTISSYGAINIFEAASMDFASVARLDDTHFIVVWRDNVTTYGEARIGSVSGTTITYGAVNAFRSASTTLSTVGGLDSTHFVVAFKDNSESNYGKAVVGLTDGGTTISSYGALNTFNAAATLFQYMAVLDSTHFVVAYEDASNHGEAIVGLVSGTTISSYGSPSTFEASTIDYMATAAIDATHFVVVYRDGGDTFGKAVVGLTSGTTISSYGGVATFNAASTHWTGVTGLDSTHFVIAYRDSGDSNKGKAIVGEID